MTQNESRVETSLEDNILTIEFNQKDKMNTLNLSALKDLKKAIVGASHSKDVHGIVFTGSGSFFVSGFDVSELVHMDKKDAKAYSMLGQEVLCLLESMQEPVIAAVNGFALGAGCELAMACDFIFASEKSKFGQTEINFGVIPGFGATSRLTKRVGLTKAKDLILTGRIIDCNEALRMGLINQIFGDDELMDKTIEFCENLIRKPKTAIALAKDAIIRGCEMDIPSANQHESEYFSWCFETEDQKEGMQAFLDKRVAEFKR